MGNEAVDGMRCPKCGYLRSETLMTTKHSIETGSGSYQGMTRRRKKCLNPHGCGWVFYTREFIENGYDFTERTIAESIPEIPIVVKPVGEVPNPYLSVQVTKPDHKQ